MTPGALVRAAHRQHVARWTNDPTAWGVPCPITELRRTITVPATPLVDVWGRPIPTTTDVQP